MELYEITIENQGYSYDITDNVVLNSFNYMKRIDEVFGTGSFQFESKTISENIAPYSILNINNQNFYCCSSEATYHYGRQSWFHNVSIIELTSLLSRFLVGSKAFSITGTNTYDWQKIDILLKLINQKYGVSISFVDNDYQNIFNKQIEYVFTAGTTLFDALNEISKQYNARFYVSYASKETIIIEYSLLDNLPTLAFDNNKVLSITKTQNSETYCKYLESEATNVIDTNQTTLVKNLFPTANDIQLNEDTFLLKLPTPAFKVEKVVANIPVKLKLAFVVPNDYYEGDEIYKTYGEWADKIPALQTIYNDILSKYFPIKNDLYSVKFVSKFVEQRFRLSSVDLDIGGGIYPYNITSHILPKEQYDLLLDKDKPDYAYYTLGSDTIDGFNINYKTDFWNSLIGEGNERFLSDIKINDETYYQKTYAGIYFSEYQFFSNFSGASYVNYSFDIEYYPISNPYIINTKQDTPTNENAYKSYSISFNKSSNYVDFDKLTNSMKIENQSMGKPELIIEYDTTDLTLFADCYKLTFDNKTWYSTSNSTRLTNDGKQITTFNLVSNYNKVADVVSLNSQYNTTKNPLENIIERPLFFETTDTYDFVLGNYYVLINFSSTIVPLHQLVFRPIIMTNGTDKYLYFSMKDQYSAGTNAIKVKDNIYKVNDVPYVDSNNEIYLVSVWIVKIDNLTQEEIKQLPIYNNDDKLKYIDLVGSAYIYKDAREKLTFTIKANNCIIK
jgi:hypothetical protein